MNTKRSTIAILALGALMALTPTSVLLAQYEESPSTVPVGTESTYDSQTETDTAQEAGAAPEAQAQTPAPSAAEPSTESEATAEEPLPQTASPLVAYGLAGLFSLAGGLGIHRLSRRRRS